MIRLNPMYKAAQNYAECRDELMHIAGKIQAQNNEIFPSAIPDRMDPTLRDKLIQTAELLHQISDTLNCTAEAILEMQREYERIDLEVLNELRK